MGSKGSKNPHTISILELKLIHLSKNDLKIEKEILKTVYITTNHNLCFVSMKAKE